MRSVGLAAVGWWWGRNAAADAVGALDDAVGSAGIVDDDVGGGGSREDPVEAGCNSGEDDSSEEAENIDNF